MVCLGNICRSPVAEGILRHKAKERGIQIETDSAGTSAFHIGEKPDSRMRAAAKRNGFDISDLRARQFIREDFDRFDLIFAMDNENYHNIVSLARNQNDIEKVKLILDESHLGGNREVPDPYYGGDEGFQYVIDLLNDATDQFLNRLNG